MKKIIGLLTIFISILIMLVIITTHQTQKPLSDMINFIHPEGYVAVEQDGFNPNTYVFQKDNGTIAIYPIKINNQKISSEVNDIIDNQYTEKWSQNDKEYYVLKSFSDPNYNNDYDRINIVIADENNRIDIILKLANMSDDDANIFFDFVDTISFK